MRQLKFLCQFCLVALSTFPLYAAQPVYKLHVLAAANSKIDGISLQTIVNVAMNDRDDVIFTAHYDDGSYAGGGGVFTPDHALLKKGDTVRGLTVGNTGICGINDFNELALTFSFGNNQTALGKFAAKGDGISPRGKLIETGDVIGGLSIQSFRECFINDLGEIEFSADYLDPAGNSGIGVFTADKVLLKAGTAVDGIPISGANSFGHFGGLSDLGTFVFDTLDELPNLGLSETAVFTQHREVARSGEVIAGLALLSAGTPYISHFNRVAFSGSYAIDPSCFQYSCQGFGAFTRDGVVAKTGDVISGISLISAGAQGINDQGTVLILGNFEGGYGLFTKDSVIARTGDTFGGFLVGGFIGAAINDLGNVAFTTGSSVVLAKHKR